MLHHPRMVRVLLVRMVLLSLVCLFVCLLCLSALCTLALSTCIYKYIKMIYLSLFLGALSLSTLVLLAPPHYFSIFPIFAAKSTQSTSLTCLLSPSVSLSLFLPACLSVSSCLLFTSVAGNL